MAGKRAADGEMVDYRGLAELLGVKVDSVRSLASDGRLPAPAARFGNSPVFAAADVNRFLDQREAGTGRQGHPSRVEVRARKAARDAAFAGRVRRRVASGDAPVASLRALAARLGLSPATLNNRLQGRTSWRAAEVAQLERILGDLGRPDSVRPN